MPDVRLSDISADVLNVAVVSGKDLIPCDLNGLADPYVIVEFRNSSTREKLNFSKSSIKFKTLNPNFMYNVVFDVKDFKTPAFWRLHIELW